MIMINYSRLQFGMGAHNDVDSILCRMRFFPSVVSVLKLKFQMPIARLRWFLLGTSAHDYCDNSERNCGTKRWIKWIYE